MKKFLLLIFASTILFAQSEKQIDSVLYSMRYSKAEDYDKNSNKLLDLFYSTDKVTGKKNCDRILNYLSALKDKNLYIDVYLNSNIFYSFKEKLKILDNGYEMAKKEDNEDLMGLADLMRGYVYTENAINDSAMFYILRAKTALGRNENNVHFISALLLIADLHYYAGDLDKAEILYKEIINKIGGSNKQKNWRYRVALGDMGLIRVKQGKYLEAEKYFTKSLNYNFFEGLKYIDSTNLAYSYRKLCEVNLLLKNYDNAENFYKKALFFAKRLNQISEMPGIYI